MQDPKTLESMLDIARTMAAEDRATISALQDVVAQQAVEIARLRTEISMLETKLGHRTSEAKGGYSA